MATLGTMWIKICGITSCRCRQRRRDRPGGRDRFRVCAEPAAGHPRTGGAACGTRARGHLEDRRRSASAADEGGRDLPHAQTGLLSNGRRGFEGAQDPAAHQGAAGRALRTQDAEPAACADRVRGADQRNRRAGRLGPGRGARPTDASHFGGRPVRGERGRGDPGGQAVRRRRELAASNRSAASRIRPRLPSSCVRRAPRPRC